MEVRETMALECFNVHHRLLAFRAKKWYCFQDLTFWNVPPCVASTLSHLPGSLCHGNPRGHWSTLLSTSQHLDNHCPDMMGWTLQSIIPWRSHQRLHSHHTTARHCDYTMSTFNPTFKWIPFYLSAEFWSPHTHSSVTKKGCGKLQKLYGVYRALPWLGVEWRMDIQISQVWNFSPGN